MKHDADKTGRKMLSDLQWRTVE